MVQGWMKLQTGHDRLLFLHFAGDMYEFLAARSVPMWPVLMTAVIQSVNSPSPGERQAASFAVLLAAQIEGFAVGYGTVLTCLKKYKPKKNNDDDAQQAEDNTVAALVQLCLSLPSQSPNLDACWEIAFTKMPLKADLDESRKVNEKLFLEVQKPGGGNLGSGPRLVQVLGYLCSIYGKSDHCDEDLQHKISSSFASIPEETLQSLGSQLSDSQRKKT